MEPRYNSLRDSRFGDDDAHQKLGSLIPEEENDIVKSKPVFEGAELDCEQYDDNSWVESEDGAYITCVAFVCGIALFYFISDYAFSSESGVVSIL